MDSGFVSHQHDFIFRIINLNMQKAGIIMTLEQDLLSVLINRF
jgi:hypothetical protein